MTELPLSIATAPVNWNNNDLPSWREIVPFPALLDRMIEAGYRVTEYDESFGFDACAVSKAVEVREMTLCGSYQWLDLLNTGVFEAQLQSLRQRLALLEALRCEHLIIADALRAERIAIAGNVSADGSASLKSDDYKRIAENGQSVAEIANERGISTHYHNHVGTWIETPAEVERLVEHLASTGVDLCFDTGHYAYGGGNPAGFLASHLSQIGYLHLKDVDSATLNHARTSGWSFLDALRQVVFAPLGQGTADIRRIVRQLQHERFAGWVVIEQDTCIGNQTDVARNNLDYVTRMLTDRGGT